MTRFFPTRRYALAAIKKVGESAMRAVVEARPRALVRVAADVADGYVYGRGAVDMKDLVAMEVEVVRLLAESATAAGLDPARDPIPGLRRDVLLAVTADEEAGGHEEAGHSFGADR
mgnify:CR=1 FL=1